MKRLNYSSIIFIIMIVLLSACNPMYTIRIDKEFDPPEELQMNFKPVNVTGKETITLGTDKTVDKSGFQVEKSNKIGMETVSISKSNIKVTVGHASFDFLKNNFGLTSVASHPLGDTYKNMHIWGPYVAPAFVAMYRAENKDLYQTYKHVPFYDCFWEVYRNQDNSELLNKFQHAFTKGEILPFTNDTRTTQEIEAQMENLIGQAYCQSYMKTNLVFYVKVENLGDEKIRLWPVQEAVVVDSNNNQYRALPPDDVKKLLEDWYKHRASLPTGKNNPIIGIHLQENNVKIMDVAKGLPAEKAGIKRGDILKQVNNISISSYSEFKSALNNKIPGDKINIELIRNDKKINYEVTLISADDWRKPPDVTVLSGGNVYPNVIYDGFLIFNTKATLNNYLPGSSLKLIIPLIGTKFTASDTPIDSFDFDFDFIMQ